MTVVTTTLPQLQDLDLISLRIRGTTIPAITELIRLITNAEDIKIAIVRSWNQRYVEIPTNADKTIPFIIETANSLLKSHLMFEAFICSKVKPLKTIVRVWVA